MITCPNDKMIHNAEKTFWSKLINCFKYFTLYYISFSCELKCTAVIRNLKIRQI